MKAFHKALRKLSGEVHGLVLGQPAATQEEYDARRAMAAHLNPNGFRSPSMKYDGNRGNPSPRGQRRRAAFGT